VLAVPLWLALAGCSAAATSEADTATAVTLPTAGLAPQAVPLPAIASSEASAVVSAPASAEREAPGRALDHKPCNTHSADAVAVDINGDGKPDVFKLFSGGKLVCRASDLNFDGALDVYLYLAPNGSEERVESDFDGDGKADAVVFRAEGGTGCVQLLDRDGDGRADSAERIDCATKLKQ
jgi:hypothetical protein